jgi:hypothetical protein
VREKEKRNSLIMHNLTRLFGLNLGWRRPLIITLLLVCLGAVAVGWVANGKPRASPLLTPIDCPTITIGTPAGSFRNVPYSSSVAATAVPAIPAGYSFTYSLASGALPDGLSLNPTTGAITGTPTSGGSFNCNHKG